MHDSGVSFRAINIFYFLLAITVVLVFTFVLPPFVITSDRVNALNGDENDELSHDSCARDEVLSTEVRITISHRALLSAIVFQSLVSAIALG